MKKNNPDYGRWDNPDLYITDMKGTKKFNGKTFKYMGSYRDRFPAQRQKVFLSRAYFIRIVKDHNPKRKARNMKTIYHFYMLKKRG